MLKVSRSGTMTPAMVAIDGFGAARASLAQAQERALDAATRLVQDVDVEAIVDLKLARTQATASAKSVRAYDEMLGTLIDELA